MTPSGSHSGRNHAELTSAASKEQKGLTGIGETINSQSLDPVMLFLLKGHTS